MAEASRQLKEANSELARLYAKTRELEQMKSQFFANVSHELRTPLALIIGPAEKLLASPEIGPDARSDLELVLKNARLLLELVNDLLDASKLEAGRMGVEYHEVDLAELVRLCAGHFDSIAREKEMVFQIEADRPLPAEVDPDKVRRVIFNLLANAFKFTPDGGRVRCTLSADASTGVAVLEIADSGPGIAVEHREIVFERFRQLDGGSTRRFGGTGLGLAIARDFVELHRGSVILDRAPEGGARFRVELPTRAPPDAIVVRGSRFSAPPPPLTPRRKSAQQASPEKPLVLVVEDNADMNAFIAETLSGECRVASAFDGRAGVERAKALHPDLILTDLMMPEMTGEELVLALRADPAFERVPIVLLSAKGDDALRVRLLEEGANDYVMKPFGVGELRVRIRNQLDGRRAEEALRQLREEALREKDRADNANRAKGKFLAAMSHELRTPLNAIIGFTELLGSGVTGPLAPKQEQFVHHVLDAAQHLLALINDILDLSKVEAGRMELFQEVLPLRGQLEQVIDSSRPLAEKKRISLALAIALGAEEVWADPVRMKQILFNLLSNAIKFTPDGGEIRVAAQRDGAGIEIAVSDTGIGISGADMRRLFGEFEQLQTTGSNRREGTGLGLALTKRLIEQHGGSITVESAPGSGSTFVVRFPDKP